MKPMLKGPGAKGLKLNYDVLLSSFACNLHVCRYNKGTFEQFEEMYEQRRSAAGVVLISGTRPTFNIPHLLLILLLLLLRVSVSVFNLKLSRALIIFCRLHARARLTHPSTTAITKTRPKGCPT